MASKPSISIRKIRARPARAVTIAIVHSLPYQLLCPARRLPLWFLDGVAVFEEPDNQGGPAGLMVSAQTFAGVAVEVLVEEHQVAPVGIIGEARIIAVAGSAAFFVR